jgi:hypothetical protein
MGRGLTSVCRAERKEEDMIELTPSAKKQLEGYFADKDVTPVRGYLSTGG